MSSELFGRCFLRNSPDLLDMAFMVFFVVCLWFCVEVVGLVFGGCWVRLIGKLGRARPWSKDGDPNDGMKRIQRVVDEAEICALFVAEV